MPVQNMKWSAYFREFYPCCFVALRQRSSPERPAGGDPSRYDHGVVLLNRNVHVL